MTSRGVLAAILVGLAATLAACSNSPSSPSHQTQSTNQANTGSTNSGSQADEVNSCESDFKVLAVAVQAYASSPNNQSGSYPAPPAAWSASTYTSNFAPLLAKTNGGPFMVGPLDPSQYVIEYDGAGHVWVEPAGTFDTTYDPAHGSYKSCQEVLG